MSISETPFSRVLTPNTQKLSLQLPHKSKCVPLFESKTFTHPENTSLFRRLFERKSIQRKFFSAFKNLYIQIHLVKSEFIINLLTNEYT